MSPPPARDDDLPDEPAGVAIDTEIGPDTIVYDRQEPMAWIQTSQQPLDLEEIR